MVELSKRLQALVDMVTPGNTVADVGCDHGYVAICLIQRGICPKVFAMDVNVGPLLRADKHIAEYGLQQYIETRLSDGLSALQQKEADAFLCAGMGGKLMQRIMIEGKKKIDSMKEFILQPQSELEAFRIFLRNTGYIIVDENMVLEDGKFYPMMKVIPSKTSTKGQTEEVRQRLEDKFGKVLLKKKHPVLIQYLQHNIKLYKGILQNLVTNGNGETEEGKAAIEERIADITLEIEDMQLALLEMEQKKSLEMEYGMVTVRVEGQTRQYPVGTTYETIASEFQTKYDGLIALVNVGGKIRELSKKAINNCEISFFTLKDDVGHKTYVRTATMILMKAIHDVAGLEKARGCRLEFTVGNGYFVQANENIAFTDGMIEKVKARMLEIITEKLPISKKAYPLAEAMELFHERGMKDKEKLFRYRRSSYVNIYEMDGYYDYYYGYMLPHAGYMPYFDLIPYEKGMMLLLPNKKTPKVIEPFKPRENFFKTLIRSQEWGEKVGIETVGDLNEQICMGNLSEMILVQEAEQERIIGEIAKDIVNRGGVKFIMIAGPSSSGKTSFSHRLSIQLKTQGMIPHPIALDNYFVNRDKTPKDENGDYNFECLEAVDVEQFNRDMKELLEGKRVELPSFNFKTGIREYKGNFKQLGPEDVLVIEGIHGLNDKTSYALPSESKYRIYISALTSLNVDEHNRIPTTDGRLLRRMVRDARTRGADAKRTIQMWPAVRKGEEENIFPFQESADAMFNSALIYELAVLKQFAEPLLFNITSEEPEYYEAKRLLKFLDYFLGVSSENLPNNSICREFVGGSCFNV